MAGHLTRHARSDAGVLKMCVPSATSNGTQAHLSSEGCQMSDRADGCRNASLLAGDCESDFRGPDNPFRMRFALHAQTLDKQTDPMQASYKRLQCTADPRHAYMPAIPDDFCQSAPDLPD